jgi:hypothetical protein
MPTRAFIQIGSQLHGDGPNASFASVRETRYRTPVVNDDERAADHAIPVWAHAIRTA